MTDSGHQSEVGRITGLLHDAAHGGKEALDQLFPLVYEELKRVARGRLRFERPGHTLNATALVHEAYFKLVGQTRVEWKNRRHFFAVAAEAMRRILIDYAKQRRAAKRGGRDRVHVALEEAGDLPAGEDLFTEDQAEELLALDDALERLAGFTPRGATIVKYRFFGGMTTEEIADLLGISERTARRSWTVAKGWLRRELDTHLARRPTLLSAEPGLPG